MALAQPRDNETECVGPLNVDLYRKTYNWRNDVMNSMNAQRVIKIADYFLETDHVEQKMGMKSSGKIDCTHFKPFSFLAAHWIDILGNTLI
jgi:hypothetical protein